MPKDPLEQFDAWLREAEAAPAELIEVGWRAERSGASCPGINFANE